MIPVVREEPYSFYAPKRSTWTYHVLRQLVPGTLRKTYGVQRVECRQMERLTASIEAGHGILLAPNHPRACDPLTVGMLSHNLRVPFYFMASWYLFRQGWFSRFMIRNLGAFSIYRETNDRACMNAAIDILATAERPMVVFAEGTISRANDHLMEMMDGVLFLARSAAKRRAKEDGGKVVIHPVATKYVFEGDLHKVLAPTVEEFEARFSWQPQRHLPLFERVMRLLEALVSLRELEHLGRACSGDVYGRIKNVIEEMLRPLEMEWLGKVGSQSVITRCKRLRTEILPELTRNEISAEERARRWVQLRTIYDAQQLSLYHEDYLGAGQIPERVIETVEGFEEDLTDVIRKHGEWRAIVQVGEAIEVEPGRRPKDGDDPSYQAMVGQVREMLSHLTAEVNAERGIAPHAAVMAKPMQPAIETLPNSAQPLSAQPHATQPIKSSV